MLAFLPWRPQELEELPGVRESRPRADVAVHDGMRGGSRPATHASPLPVRIQALPTHHFYRPEKSAVPTRMMGA